MPLTPAEVHNVAFKKPPIGKRGYDEEEVDAFLDIVEVELSRLIEENNELRARNGGAPGPLNGAVNGVDPAVHDRVTRELSSSKDENERMKSQVAELQTALSQGKDGAQQQVVQLQQQLAATEQQLANSRRQLDEAQHNLAQAKSQPQPAGGSPVLEHHTQAVQVLAMAQQTADQHLSQSKAEAERLLAEARAHSENTVNSAHQQAKDHIADAENRARQLDNDSTARANQTVQEAEQRAATITTQLQERQAALERRVEELRTFEREYRTRLKSYLESQLRDLDASGQGEPATEDAQVG